MVHFLVRVAMGGLLRGRVIEAHIGMARSRRHGQISRAVLVRRIDGSRSWDRGGGSARGRSRGYGSWGRSRFRRAALAQEGAPIARDLRAGKRTGALERPAVCGASRL